MSKWRVMIVDDEPDVIAIIRQALEPKYEVVEAHNGLDALEKIERFEPDFIILDVMMPLMDGFDTCAAIRRNPQFRQTPIYFLTSSHSPEDIKKGYMLGCDLFLQKPFDPLRLLKNIDFHFEKHPMAPVKKKFSLDALKVVVKKPPQLREKPQPEPAPTPAAHKREPISMPPISPRPRPKQTVSIMVIDDDLATLDFIEAALSSKTEDNWLFETIATSNPIDALSKIVNYEPDIILLDIRMPKLDGFQLCKIIKLNQNLQDTEILFMSATVSTSDLDVALKITGNPLLKKPFNREQVREAIIAICEKPAFTPKIKKMKKDEITKQLNIQEQEFHEQIRKAREKEFQENKLRALTDFYKELNEEVKHSRPK